MASCKCDNPPGGSGRCPVGYIALCLSNGSECNVSCSKPNNRILSMIRNGQILNSPEAVSSMMLDIINTMNVDNVGLRGDINLSAMARGQFIARGRLTNGDTFEAVLPSASPLRKKSFR